METQVQEKMTAKIFVNKVLAGTALGVIIGLIPNAVLSAILKYFSTVPIAQTIIHIAVIFQLATPLIIGGLIALQFGFKPMQMMVTAGAAFVASGVVTFNTELGKYVGAGTGDLINTMLTAAIAVGMLMLIKDRFGSTAVVAMPIVVGVGAAFIGLLLLPFVKQITTGIGVVINEFTHFQPLDFNLLFICLYYHFSNLNCSYRFSYSIKRNFSWCFSNGSCCYSCCFGCSFLESK